jgi:hypothetical protein
VLKDPGHLPGGGTGRGPQLVSSHDLIRAKQQIPDDPLAGLPSDDGNHGGHGKGSARGSSRAACAVTVSAANERDIGDLRAALALLKHGPKSLPCPVRAAPSDMQMRISIDGDGKITAAEPAAGDRGVANTVAKRLAGKSIGPWAAGATVGIVVVTFTSGKP